jgi:hypothetical protein
MTNYEQHLAEQKTWREVERKTFWRSLKTLPELKGGVSREDTNDSFAHIRFDDGVCLSLTLGEPHPHHPVRPPKAGDGSVDTMRPKECGALNYNDSEPDGRPCHWRQGDCTRHQQPILRGAQVDRAVRGSCESAHAGGGRGAGGSREELQHDFGPGEEKPRLEGNEARPG